MANGIISNIATVVVGNDPNINSKKEAICPMLHPKHLEQNGIGFPFKEKQRSGILWHPKFIFFIPIILSKFFLAIQTSFFNFICSACTA